MGNQQGVNEEYFKYPNIPTLYAEFVKEFDDSSFGDIQIYSAPKEKPDQESELIAIKQKNLQDKEKIEILFSEAETRIHYAHPNLLQLLGYKFVSQNNICGGNHRCLLYYEYYSHTLDIEISRRNKKNEFFAESEIWYMIDALCSVGLFFQENGIYHGDIQPKHVFLDNMGRVKLGDHGLTNNYPSAFIKALVSNEFGYLSPQLLEALVKRHNEPTHNVFKSDVWAVGLTILQACSLNPSSLVYDQQNLILRTEVIAELLETVQRHYSTHLVQVVELMLQIDERIRPDFVEIVSGFPLYKPTYFESKVTGQPKGPAFLDTQVIHKDDGQLFEQQQQQFEPIANSYMPPPFYEPQPYQDNNINRYIPPPNYGIPPVYNQSQYQQPFNPSFNYQNPINNDPRNQSSYLQNYSRKRFPDVKPF